MNKKIAVISNAFESLERCDGVYTIGRLEELLKKGGMQMQLDDESLMLGQVFSEEDRERIKKLLGEYGVDGDLLPGISNLVKSSMVHKKHEKNVMLSNIRVSGGYYTCDLIISKDNEMVADHVTGEHISGMALIEAARQLNIAAIDRNFSDGKSRYQVIHDLSTEFKGFVHPFETEMRLRFDDFTPKGAVSIIDSVVDFMQCGEIRTSVRMRGSACTFEFAKKMENKSVKRLLRGAGVRQPEGVVA